MKRIVRICLTAAILGTGFGYVHAQSAASSSKEVVQIEEQPAAPQTPPMIDSRAADQRSDRGFPMPVEIEELLRANKVAEAERAYEKFQAQQKGKASPYDLLYNACGFYGWAKEIDPSYKPKYEALQKQMFEEFPDEPEVYLMQITEETTDEQIVDWMTKAIAKNPQLSILYEYRGRSLMNLKQTEAACRDFEKLSNKDMMPEYWPCLKLKQE